MTTTWSSSSDSPLRRPPAAPEVLRLLAHHRRLTAEIERRRAAPATPGDFAIAASGGRWQRPAHLDLLDRKLTDLAHGRIRRLLVTMPPRHGKSELCSRYFPAWFVGRFPGRNIILTSYEASFAASWGAKARDLLAEHGGLFGVSVNGEQARDLWGCDDCPGRMATAGVGGPITGKGAHLLIVDDPVKGAEDANSPTMRAKTWDWWQSVAYTRLEPDGVALVIQTRWHEDDLAGRLLAQQLDGEDDEPWGVVDLPAVARDDDPIGRRPGEALWPQRWPLSRLKVIAKKVGSYVWSALYQQRPTSPEGDFYRRDWFASRYAIADVPPLERRCRAWDLASTEPRRGATDPDYTVGLLGGIDDKGIVWLLDRVKVRKSSDAVERAIADAAQRDGRDTLIRLEQEGGSSGKGWINAICRGLADFDIRGDRPQGDKLTRAQPANAAAERGDVRIVAGNWGDDFVETLAGFPRGGHDDDVDALSLLYATLQRSAAWDATAVRDALTGGGRSTDAGRPQSPRELMLERLSRRR